MASERPLADRVDRVLSLSAVVAALSAVAVSVYQAQISRQQQKASAWPYVMQGNSYARGMPYRWRVENAGVGPARVRTFEVRVDGKPRRRWSDVVRALTGESEPALVYTHVGRGTVLLPGTTLEALVLPENPRTVRFFAGAQTRLSARLCYCSVYDDCWLSDSDRDEPTPVRECPTDTTRAFQQ
ncbi:MAG: hypothetical protein JO040_07725 [Gemmatimonadetes bacterium]|nr:hypothetical protein [Gemmatimonadota bacterium]